MERLPFQLPVCRWRTDDLGIPGRVGCRSPIIDAGPYGVVPARCFACTEADHLDQSAQAARLERPGDVRHLLMHVYPVGQWRRCLEQVHQRLSLFNGLRCLSFAQGAGTAPRDECEAAVRGWDARTYFPTNDPARKELVSYHWLMQQLLPYRSPQDVHFYCHSKAVCSGNRPDFDAAWTWAEAMYEALLDHWPAVRRELENHATVGIFRRGWARPLGTRAQWHFSGAFRWVRNADLFSRRWEQVQDHWLGVEMHVGEVFGRAEGSCLYGDFSTQDYGLYQSSEWRRWATPQREAWLASHGADKQSPQITTVILTSHVQPELVHEAIASVLAQTSDAWQLVIVATFKGVPVDAFSRYLTDARVSVVDTGEGRSWYNGPRGQAHAINAALREGRVRGDLVSCLSDDDRLAPGWVAAVQAAAADHPDQCAWWGMGERWALTADGVGRRLGLLLAGGVIDADHPGRGRIDGGQVVLRRSSWVDWPEAADLASQADGYWLDDLARDTPIHPVGALALIHRNTPLSTFTRG